MKITKVLNPQNLIKPSVTLECRRFYPKGKQWTVICRSGWGTDRPISYERFLSKEQARKIARDFTLEHEDKTKC